LYCLFVVEILAVTRIQINLLDLDPLTGNHD
jgi:hypothetical protein